MSLATVESADHTFGPLRSQERLQLIVESALEEVGVLPGLFVAGFALWTSVVIMT